ncbi:hypothetical protein ACHAXT_012699 [Thalassiosira profunda]
MKLPTALLLAGLLHAAGAVRPSQRLARARAAAASIDAHAQQHQRTLSRDLDDSSEGSRQVCGDGAEGGEPASPQNCTNNSNPAFDRDSDHELVQERASTSDSASANHLPRQQTDADPAPSPSIPGVHDVTALLWSHLQRGLEYVSAAWAPAEKPEQTCEEWCLQSYFAGEIPMLKGCTKRCRAERPAGVNVATMASVQAA